MGAAAETRSIRIAVKSLFPLLSQPARSRPSGFSNTTNDDLQGRGQTGSIRKACALAVRLSAAPQRSRLANVDWTKRQASRPYGAFAAATRVRIFAPMLVFICQDYQRLCPHSMHSGIHSSR